MNILKKVAGAVAALAVALAPSAALAQQAGPQNYQPTPPRAVQVVAPSGDMTVQKVELAPGFFLPPEEARLLARYKCVVGPVATLTAELYDWAERKGVVPCSPKFWTKVDDYIGKESTLGYRAMDGADGYEYCPNMKVSNMGNNRESCRTYVPVDRYVVNGQVGKFGDVNWATGGGSAKAQALTTFGGAFIAGPMAAATGQLLAPGCGPSGCGPQVVNNVASLAEAGAVSQSATNVEIGTPCVGTTCGSQPSSPPAHYAPSGDNTAYQPGG
jgi:hypothetical protein